jgi:serine/threonine protein kinase
MTPARWERVQELFHLTADLDEVERAKFLYHACGDDSLLLAEVQRMLDQDGREWLLDHDSVEIAGRISDAALFASFEESSPYRLLRVLGEGGTGVVYLAERKDLGNRVAIKILHVAWLSPGRRERFTAEQRTLAQLTHSSIAHLYDASSLPDGTPWFVMEYVDGVSITEHCSQKGSSMEERVRLIRAVAEAVQYAHEHGVIHRDLKPSNILVKDDGAVRLVDFGIAKQLDPMGHSVSHTRTAFRQMTTAYASPEQLRGEAVGPLTDVYSLGGVLYELLAGRPPFDLAGKNVAEAERMITMSDPAKPSALARSGGKVWWADLDALCLKAIEKDPQRRYPSMSALIRDIDRYLNHEPVEARRVSWAAPVVRAAQRNWRAISLAIASIGLVVAAVFLTLLFSRKPESAPERSRAVAVLPFENAGNDRSFDFLSIALADQISRTLDYGRHISVRAPELSRKYAPPAVNPQTAGRQLGADTVVTGRFMRTGDQLQITLDLIDVATNHSIWTDVFEVPAQNMMAIQALVALKTRRTMAPVLGVTAFVRDALPQPKNEEAYKLYLEALPNPDLISIDPAARKRVIGMLERSVQLDPTFSPAWELLCYLYTENYWWGNGGTETLAKKRIAVAKVLELEPDNVRIRAVMLYDSGHRSPEDGGIPLGKAYRGVKDLLRRRPDSARVHFVASWILREAGLLDESARECETSMIIDAKDAGSRSCGVTFMLLGKYPRAMDFLRLDETAEISRAVRIEILLRQGKAAKLLQSPERLPQWGGYDMVLAFLRHDPQEEVSAMANKLSLTPDPETNYLSATHLSYAGQTEAALAMLKRTVDEGYCSYPGMDSDPLLANLRSQPEFAEIRAAGMRCQNKFLSDAGMTHSSLDLHSN